MDTTEKLQSLLDTYQEQATAAYQHASVLARAFNLSNDDRNHPCHDRFYNAVGETVAQFLQESPSEQDAYAVLCWLLQSASAHKDEPTYWYLYAIHGYALPVIDRVSPADCAEMLAWYENAYPRRDRMPAQEKVRRALKSRAAKN